MGSAKNLSSDGQMVLNTTIPGNVSFDWNLFLENFKAANLKIGEPTTIVLLVLYIPVFVAALLGNILVIVVVVKRKHKPNLTEYFLLNLAVADLLVTLFCIPLSVAEAVYTIWIYGEIMCKSTVYLQGISISASVLTITALCFDRYLAIRHPLKSRRIGNKCYIRTTMFIIWLVSAVIMLPLGLVKKLRALPDIPETDIRFCTEEWSDTQHRKIYDIFLLCFIYAIPGSLMIGMYLAMGRKLWHTGSILNRKGSDISGLQRMLSERRRVARMMVIVALLFGLCWLPYHIVSTGIDFEWNTNEYLIALRFSLLLGHLNSALNPIVYAFMYENFRKRVTQAFRCRPSTSDSQVYELVKVSVFSAANGSRASQFLSRSSKYRQSTVRFTVHDADTPQKEDHPVQKYACEKWRIQELNETSDEHASQSDHSHLECAESSGSACCSARHSYDFDDTQPLQQKRDSVRSHSVDFLRLHDGACTDSDDTSPIHSFSDLRLSFSEKPLMEK